MLYHGCDDVGDQRGLEALGGGGEEDIRDGILTLPAALAIRDPRIRELFATDDDEPERLATLADACRAQLDEAEVVLDRIADSARAEAERVRRADPSRCWPWSITSVSCRGAERRRRGDGAFSHVSPGDRPALAASHGRPLRPVFWAPSHNHVVTRDHIPGHRRMAPGVARHTYHRS